MGPTAGVSTESDGNGFYTYVRPEGKSGGHGVGWSEMPRYEFKIPDGWEETPVSIADLGGTEVRGWGVCDTYVECCTDKCMLRPQLPGVCIPEFRLG